jgi:hypothetical protein
MQCFAARADVAQLLEQRFRNPLLLPGNQQLTSEHKRTLATQSDHFRHSERQHAVNGFA